PRRARAVGAATVGRPAMRRLSRLVAGEAVLALMVLGIVAAMSVTPPARHSDPVWPLSFRLSLDTLAAAPDFRSQVLIGSQIAVLGLVALLASAFLRRLRWPIAAGGLVVLVSGAAIALPPLVSDAYPTTYQRPAVPYQATSIADGHALFARHCAVCHGPRGGGRPHAAASGQGLSGAQDRAARALHAAGLPRPAGAAGRGPGPARRPRRRDRGGADRRRPRRDPQARRGSADLLPGRHRGR